MQTMIKMAHKARFGLCLWEGKPDAFWVQVFDAVYKQSQTLPVEIIPLSFGGFSRGATPEERLALLEDIVTQELDVLIGWPLPESLAYTFLESGLAIVHLSETEIRHPLSVSPVGLGKVAEEIATFLADQLNGEGEVLVVGGLLQPGLPDDGRSRIAGIKRVFARYPKIRYRHVPAYWSRHESRAQLEDVFAQPSCSFDAILGLSDTLALAARDIAREYGQHRRGFKLAGINGDPMAIAAILDGSMNATIETSAVRLGTRAVELACDIAYDQAYDPHFSYQTRLITAESAAGVASEKLAAFDQLITIPFELRESERLDHLVHLETSLNIGRQLSTVLDEDRLPSVLGSLIRDAYGFNHLRLAYWQSESRTFRVVELDRPEVWAVPSLETTEIYRDALVANRLILVPDQQSSLRYEPDSQLPEVRSRVVLPVRCGAATLGLLDLSADQIIHCTRMHLLGLQALADQFGIATQNARFYRQLLDTSGAPEPLEAVSANSEGSPHSAEFPAQDRRAGAPVLPTRRAEAKTSQITQRAVAYVAEHYGDQISRSDLAVALGVSENYLTDLFHREMGVSLWTYLNRYRVTQAKDLLVTSEAKITDIALRVGFNDPAYFSRVFRRYTGRSPKAFRNAPLYGDASGA